MPHPTEGATPSFEDFYRSHQDDALALARSLLGGDGAEDACQDAWVLAWRDWGKVRGDRLDLWLLRLVRRCCEAQERGWRVVELLRDDESAPCPSFEDDVIAALQATAIWKLLGNFPRHLRDVLFLRGALDLSYAEIAELQQVPMGTVMSRLHEARRRAQARLRNSNKIEYSHVIRRRRG